ncbi:MAG: 2-amino-4-hydroxy-6-hydroxymethyldihydropteridine diphosphokinase [Anaerolineales bacterium]
MSDQPVELAFVAVGSNISPEVHLPASIEHLHSLGQVKAISNAYKSNPVGGRNQPDFLNAAVLIGATEEPAPIRDHLREIESALGRVRTEDRYASRTIDLDLVMYGDRVDPEFPLPDPEILTRDFVAVPLAELAPDFCHPITGEALGAIAARLRSSELRQVAKLSQRLLDLLT